MKTITPLFFVAACCTGSLALADTPFDGTWHLNTAKSQLAGDTMSFEDLGDGTLKYTDSSQSYSFKPDGSAFVTPSGRQRTFKKTTDSTYTTTTRQGAVLLSTATWTLSSDGGRLVIESKGTKPNGDTFDDTAAYARTSPGKGLIGGWKSTEVKLSSPNELTFRTDGNEVTLLISSLKASCHAKWDGKDYSCSGPTVPEGITVSLSKSGPRSFKFIEKLRGKVLEIQTFRVSADGNTMVTQGTNGEGKEPYTEVWEKKS